jgi:hypothetical protein
MRTVAVAVVALLLLLVPVASGVASETSASSVVLDRTVSAASDPGSVLARALLVPHADDAFVDGSASIEAAGTSGLETGSGVIGRLFLVGLVVALLVGVAARVRRRFSTSPPHELRSLALRGYLRMDPVTPRRGVREDWTMVPLRPADDRLTAREAAWYGATFTVGMAPTTCSLRTCRGHRAPPVGGAGPATAAGSVAVGASVAMGALVVTAAAGAETGAADGAHWSSLRQFVMPRMSARSKRTGSSSWS